MSDITPEFQKLIDEVFALNIKDDKELVRVLTQKISVMYPDKIHFEHRILAGLLAEKVRSTVKTTQPAYLESYEMWMPVHPDFMVNKETAPGSPLYVCLYQETAQKIFDRLKRDNPYLKTVPTKVTFGFLLEFGKSQGYDLLFVMETGEKFQTISKN